ncbi:hypothetical protein CRI94_07905 [Longibacter salinarum]|uniref:Helicase HerA barrel domain-containing protein n=1 Tax=Longibacter salinarum TaxID=1850348 RepID=A0A2A8CZY8_9BACT|nr:HAS-barrel domain-containing protein [Longibacter salinarum]PEN13968.1 hypothetical protein CRI94_07905 [Longibacter salinarum]
MKVAEVIESSTRSFVAEVYNDNDAPAFGTWVRADGRDGRDIFGLISHVEVGSYDGNRQAVALGVSEEDRQREWPMVQELLRTTVHAQILAHRDRDGRVRQTLPAQPPGIHAFTYRCEEDIVRELGAPYDFLRTLITQPADNVPVDDLLVAVLRHIYTAHGGETGGRPELVRAGRTLSRLLDDDHERLQSVLRRIL